MSARPQVTITLGRTGQVVKRTGSTSDNIDHFPSYGGKRPVGDRLGSAARDSYSYGADSRSKRQRRDDNYHNWSGDDKQNVASHSVDRNDLRHKLTSKSLSRWSTSNHERRHPVDLREKLSRSTRTSSRSERQIISTARAPDHARRIAPTRSADDLLWMDSLRKSYNSNTTDGLRPRFPDRLTGAFRDISPRRNYDEARHASSVRSAEISRPSTYYSRSMVDDSRKTSDRSKTSVPVETPRPMGQVPSSSVVIPKSSYTSEEPLTMASLLYSLGLDKYAILFQAEEIDISALKQMGDNDLKELGIPMGPRKKILLAMLPQSERRA